jgi:hypothetical protein
MKPYHLIIPALFLFYSCHQSEVKIVDGPKFSVNKGKKERTDLGGQSGDQGTNGGFDATQGTAFGALNTNNANKKIEPEVIVEELPRTYKQRKFLNDVSGFTNDLFMIPGNIVTYNPKDSSYQFRTLKAIIKGNKAPIVTSIGDGSIYSAKINSTTSFNGTYLIGGLTVNRDEIMELNIADVAISTVPDSLMDIDAIKSAISQIPDDEKKNTFFIKAATLTFLDSRKYTESKFDASVNSCFVTAGGKTYSSNEKFRRDKSVSMWIIPLDRILNSVH